MDFPWLILLPGFRGPWFLAWKDLEGSTRGEQPRDCAGTSDWKRLQDGLSRKELGENDKEGTSRITTVSKGLNSRLLEGALKPTEKWLHQRHQPLCPPEKEKKNQTGIHEQNNSEKVPESTQEMLATQWNQRPASDHTEKERPHSDHAAASPLPCCPLSAQGASSWKELPHEDSGSSLSGYRSKAPLSFPLEGTF